MPLHHSSNGGGIKKPRTYLLNRRTGTNIQLRYQYKLKRISNKECCKQCRYVMFKGTMTKCPVQKLTQGTTQKLLQHNDATDI